MAPPEFFEIDMFANDLIARLSRAIYPVMILAGAAWGATGEAGMGLAALLGAAVVLAAVPRYTRN